jgi:hypothetical protein
MTDDPALRPEKRLNEARKQISLTYQYLDADQTRELEKPADLIEKVEGEIADDDPEGS